MTPVSPQPIPPAPHDHRWPGVARCRARHAIRRCRGPRSPCPSRRPRHGRRWRRGFRRPRPGRESALRCEMRFLRCPNSAGSRSPMWMPERISMPNVSASDQQMMSMAGSRLRRFVGRAERASGSEELRPGIHFGMLPEQRSPLAFGHAAPHAELHLVVKRVGEALGGHQTRPANRRSVPLRCSADEQIVGIGEATPRLRHPADAGVEASWRRRRRGHKTFLPAITPGTATPAVSR